MNIRKTLSVTMAVLLAAGTLFVVSQNVSLSMPKSLGYQKATVAGFSFSAGRFSANSYVTVDLLDQSQVDVPVAASFNAAKLGQSVCLHASTQWLSPNLTYRFAAPRKCLG